MRRKVIIRDDSLINEEDWPSNRCESESEISSRRKNEVNFLLPPLYTGMNRFVSRRR